MADDLIKFEDFELDRAACELRRNGVVIPLQRIPLELLCLLVERPGRLVTREEILERVWGKGVFVDSENSINTAVRKVRRALQDDPDTPRFVATVQARGYRFVAEVQGPKLNTAEQFRPRGPSVMVGRERELASLLDGLDTTISGRGGLFLISGEPGIGKTRLAQEAAAVGSAKGMATLAGHCSEHAESVAYLPFVAILESFIDRAANLDSLRAAMGEEGPELVRLLPKLRNLLPELRKPLELPPEQARRHLFNSFCDFIARIAKERPTLMILEDLHWADDSTLSLLDHLTMRLSDLPLMLIGTYRDAASDVNRELAKVLEDFLRGRLASRVELKRLPRDDVAAMLANLSGKLPPATVVGEIYAETEGNPFFVEELFRHLGEENRLYDSAGHFRPELKIGELEAPPSIRLVVARRLERLSDQTQKVLATAATIGRFFDLELLEASRADDADFLEESIEEAERAGLVSSLTQSPGTRFQFSHELIRQGMIGSLAATRRQRLHLEVAAAIERTYSVALDDYYGELARHYRLGGDFPNAIDYLTRAADWAALRAAPQQAIAMATSALELLAATPGDEHHDRRELALQVTLGSCESITKGGGAPEVERAYARALELCGRAALTPAAVRAMTGLYTYYSRGADFQRAAAIQAQLLELVPTVTDPRLLATIHFTIGFRLLYFGDFEQARYQLEQARRWSVGRRLHVHASAALALTMWNLGYPAQASQLIEQAGAEGREFPDPFAHVMVVDNACMICVSSKDAAGAKILADQVTSISTTYGFGSELVFASIVHAWVAGCGGDPEAAARLRQSLVEFAAVHGELSRSFSFGLIAELCLKFGRNDLAVAAVEEGMQIMTLSGEAFAESEIYRVRGEAEQQLGRARVGAAIKWFERAIDAARKRGARIAELRATVNLARVLSKQHKRAKARAMLAEIYAWFTEGFDTADLKDAKSLLDELSE